ncbi:GGDEF domain-containing protein [uncultured Marinobacter sp.]|uniref:GGDEF domain-containing protein n=1 Tax=uncultured Marinobacter sp. TaxID=187379 RepID=UPI00260A7614|nr:GGDEF domain-containing protein [uncultured Marinobacter sp.]
MNDLTTSSQQGVEETEELRISRILTWLSLMAIVFLAGIGTKAWFASHYYHATILWAFAAPLVANMLWFAHTGNRTLQKTGLITTVGVLFSYLIASGGESNTGPLWFYVFPPLLFYLTSLKTGTVILSVFYLVAIVVFRFPELPMVTAEYTTDFKIRFFSTLTFESILCFVLEASRLKARNELVALARAHEHAARTDELTGLANRREMQHRLDAEFSRYERSGHHFSIALIDLDLFKGINDRYGHHAGDETLKTFSALMRRIIRQSDIAARWGGEEFLLLLPDTSLLQALALAERLRVEVVRTEFMFRGQRLPVSISAGVCSIAKAGSVDELLKQADIHLYSAKDAGRNQIAPRVRPHQADNEASSPA